MKIVAVQEVKDVQCVVDGEQENVLFVLVLVERDVDRVPAKVVVNVFHVMELALIGVQVKNVFPALDEDINNAFLAQEGAIVLALRVQETAILDVTLVQEVAGIIVCSALERGPWIANSVLA